MAKRKSFEDPLTFLNMGDNEWKFDTPTFDMEVHDQFYDALELGFSDFGGIIRDPARVKEATQRLQLLIYKHPQHLDAYNHLALIYEETGRLAEAQVLWERAANIGMLRVLSQFCSNNTLKWGWMDNRPFLRTLLSLGMQRMKWNSLPEAITIFETILNANPNDNQGVRSLLVECYFRADRPEKVLRLCLQFPDDTEQNILYGKVLALLRLKKQEKAEKALAEAARCLPHILRELAKKTHRRPSDMDSSWITHGSAEQAYTYWDRQGAAWKNTPGALEFVKEFAQKNKPVKVKEKDHV